MTALLCGALAFELMVDALVRLWVPADGVTRALQHFTPETLEAARAYLPFLRNLNAIHQPLLLSGVAALVLTPLGARVSDAILRFCGGRMVLASATAILAFLVGSTLLSLPFDLASHAHRMSMDMTTQSFPSMLWELALGTVIGGLVAFPVVGAVAWAVKRAPRRGWMLAAGLMCVVTVGSVALSPILVEPLFNTFTPLEETPFASQAPSLRALCLRAGVAADAPLLVINASKQGVESNAYVTGVLGSQRIVLFDTLLEKHTPAQVENTLAHELGHWRLGHVTSSLVLGCVAIWLGCLAFWWLLRASRGRGPLAPDDLHGPRSVVLAVAVLLSGGELVEPLAMAFSRVQETAADDAGLELTHDVCTFVEDEKRYLVEARADPVPHPVRQLLGSHPHAVERMERACATAAPQPACCRHPGP